MSNEGIPTSFEQWLYWMEVRGKMRMTTSYIRERLAELEDDNHVATKEFARIYGADHLQNTISWFHRAADQLAQDSGLGGHA